MSSPPVALPNAPVPPAQQAAVAAATAAAGAPLNNTMNSRAADGTQAQAPTPGPGLPGVTIAPPQKQHAAGPNVVGVHYKVGKKIGEGSFGIIYEGASTCRYLPDHPLDAALALINLCLRISIALID